jgi:RNA polymerase sigma-70 factor, ECF subfamily
MRSDREHTLIESAKEGNEAAFRTLYEENAGRIRAAVAKHVRDADEQNDLVQLVFVRAFGRLTQFRGDSEFSTWLTRIAINVCLSYHRSRAREQRRIEENQDAFADLQATVPLPDRRVEVSETASQLRRGLGRLPTNYGKAIDLRFFRHRSYREISEDLKIPVGTVKIWIHRGRKLLKRQLIADAISYA